MKGLVEWAVGVSALPAHVLTYTVVLIWLTGAFGLESASKWWNSNSGATTIFVQVSMGIWLAYRAGTKVASAIQNKEEVCKDSPT